MTTRDGIEHGIANAASGPAEYNEVPKTADPSDIREDDEGGAARKQSLGKCPKCGSAAPWYVGIGGLRCTNCDALHPDYQQPKPQRPPSGS